MNRINGNERGNSKMTDLFIKQGESLVKLKIRDILYIEDLLENVAIVTEKGKFIINKKIDWIGNMFPSDLFIRINNSYLVNKTAITSVNEISVEVASGESYRKLPVDRLYSSNLVDIMNRMAGVGFFQH
jgi:DNA-binding LytR/AlgR family response regulator